MCLCVHYFTVDLSPGEVILDPRADTAKADTARADTALVDGYDTRLDVRSSLPVSILAGNLLPRQQCSSPEIRISTPRDKVTISQYKLWSADVAAD